MNHITSLFNRNLAGCADEPIGESGLSTNPSLLHFKLERFHLFNRRYVLLTFSLRSARFSKYFHALGALIVGLKECTNLLLRCVHQPIYGSGVLRALHPSKHRLELPIQLLEFG